MKNLSTDKLYCFSPPVMIATFLIEVFLAGYAVIRYKMNATTRVAVAILTCLAAFQLAEYNVCEGAWGITSTDWARLGYVAITLLPPLGIHLVAKISGDARRWPYYGAYSVGALFVSFFLFATNGITAGACLGNYVIFEQGHGTVLLYGVYYYGLLLAAIYYAARLSTGAPVRVKKALHALIGGYALFMVPTTLVNIVDPSTVAGIPSIMCGFAVMLALIVAGSVLPVMQAEESLQKDSVKEHNRAVGV